MAEAEPRVALPGSERFALPGATPSGPVDAGEQLTVTVLVRRRANAREIDLAALGRRLPAEREHLSRDGFAAERGADSDDLGRVEEFGRAHGLRIVESSAERRSVLLSGSATDVCRAFGVELSRYRHPGGGDFRGRTGYVRLPAHIAPLVRGVFGLDDRPQAQPHFRVADPAAVSASFTPVEVASLYRFPGGVTGQGQCIGIIELGGGYGESDLESFFGRLGLPVPPVTAVQVDGGSNDPTGDPNGADAEVLLDIEVAGAVAPAARVAVYFAPNTDQGFIDAVTTAVHDRQNAPSVISISWGGPEGSWTAQAQRALDEAFADAAALGVTVCVASGDNGGGDGVGAGRAHVDFPASSPHVLACGGTHLVGSGGAITAETVWNGGRSGGATGGGISDRFEPPSWQQSAGVPASVNGDGRAGRGVPDVAGDADPATGYQIEVDGRQATIGGTSAVAPLWAGLIALINEHLGRPAGYLNPLLYSQAIAGSGAFRDITSGDNTIAGAPGYPARTGWDACTGLGSPDGQALLEAITTG
jgi:kumamolisin